jgi:hypothetical protein
VWRRFCTLGVLLTVSAQLSVPSIRPPRDPLAVVVKFALVCCKDWCLDSQLIGNDVFASPALIQSDDQLFGQMIDNDIFTFLVDRDLHDDGLVKFAGVICTGVAEVPVSNTHLVQMGI